MSFPFFRSTHCLRRRYIRSWCILGIASVTIITAMQISISRFFVTTLSIVFMLYFPGWWASFIWFPFTEKIDDETGASSHLAFDIIERITLAIVLSIIVSSIVVFVLHYFPGGSRLNPENLGIAIMLLNSTLFGAAAFRKNWIHFAYALSLGAFPLIIIGANQIFAVALSIKNFVIEILLLSLVLLIVWAVTTSKFKSLNDRA